MNNLPLEASRIAEMGYPVFLCYDPRNDPNPPGKKGKIPLVKGGVISATIDLNQIAEWWQRWPTANIGLASKDCLVLDLDTTGGKNGVKDAETIAEALGPLEPTVIAATGSGGWHLFFARPNVDIVGRTTTLWNGNLTGIDIRIGNQYVIAAPSLHENGNLYQWTRAARAAGNAGTVTTSVDRASAMQAYGASAPQSKPAPDGRWCQ